MKKPVVKIFSIILCAVLALGGMGGIVYALGVSAEAAPAADPAPADSDVQTTAPKTTSSYDPDAERNVKDETVYVLASADGSVQKIIVSDWVKNALGADTIDDVSQLTDIENVKGNETFTMGGGSSCVWDAQGNDVYYQGSIDKDLPVSVSVSYTLDGQPISPEALAGKSGKVTIRFDYTNNQYEMVSIDGRQEKIYVPFAMLTGLLLDNDVFTNVSVSNGKIMNDGDRTIVAGLAFPGLQDSLGLNRDTLELPDYVEITADVKDFALETTVTLAANGLFGKAMDEKGSFNGLDGLQDDLDKLTDAMDQLLDGSSQLYDGLCTLLTSSEELVKGIDQLAAGAAQLKQGANGLSAGAAQLQAGSAALSQGLNQLAGNNDTLNGGAAQVFQTLLSTANAQLQAAGIQAPELTAENYAQVLEGVIAAAGESPAAQQVAALKASLDSYNGFYQGLQNYTAGVAQSAAGAGELNQGIGTLKNGADSLAAGAAQLYDGILTMKNGAPALIDGVTRLRDGAMELNDGLKQFNEEGIQKLVDAFDGSLNGLMDRVDAVRAVSERYNSFSGISADMDGQVKFIWRTDAVEARD
ncbi:MAG: hypothetical protein HDT33_07095 [Clostridiales bacterium]|nr:hypothetical protein [Clostridiales bacterium]